MPVKALGSRFRGRFLHLARKALPGVEFPNIPWEKRWVVYSKGSSRMNLTYSFDGIMTLA